MEPLKEKVWWEYLGSDLQELLRTSFLIYEKTESWTEKFYDYSFIVFPAAKAYEGFLKKLFLDLGFITSDDYYGKHFRIGKALNPNLPKEIRNEGIYGKIVGFSGDSKLAETLWETWRVCRNLTFHWFPNEKNALSLDEAGERLQTIVTTIDLAFKECKIK